MMFIDPSDHPVLSRISMFVFVLVLFGFLQVSFDTALYAQGSKKKNETYLNRVEFYDEVRARLNKEFPKWRIVFRGQEHVIYRNSVAIVPFEKHKYAAKKESELSKTEQMELVIVYKPFSYQEAIEKGESMMLDRDLQLKEKYGMSEIMSDDGRGLFYASNRDQKNRLAKYLLAKKVLIKEEVIFPDLYVEDYEVDLDKKRPEFYKVYPQEVEGEVDAIYAMVKEVIKAGKKKTK